MKKHNFFAGPAILPQKVFRQAAEAIDNFADMGLSLLEISHRSPQFVAVLEESRALVKELLNVPESHEILFLTGGASTQFFMTPLNFLRSDQSAAYINTGTWSTKSIKEAKLYGNIDIVASSEDQGFSYIPKKFDISDEVRYLHVTTNNTIYGTQYQMLPKVDVPLVTDMSSDIFSRRVDVSKHMLIYAGAQKNTGPAGTTLVILKKEELGKTGRTIPTMLDYMTHVKKNSSFNTPPVFPIYVSMLNLRWVKENGGVEAMRIRNAKKAETLYAEIDRNGLFTSKVSVEDRSHMNATFLLKDTSLEDAFLSMTEDANCAGLKGHRSVGGFRASMYNALEQESVEVLVDVMKEFERKHG